MKQIVKSIEEVQLSIEQDVRAVLHKGAKIAATAIIKDEDFREEVMAQLVAAMMKRFTVGKTSVSEDRLKVEHLLHFTISMRK